MKVTATFRGGNSLGYINGKNYILKIDNFESMHIKREDGTGRAEYESLSAFLRNWDNIKQQKSEDKL